MNYFRKMMALFLALTLSLGTTSFLQASKQNQNAVHVEEEENLTNSNHHNTCSICYEDCNILDENVRLLDCGHAFHENCIKE